jgi:hypothetical protein
MRRGCSVEAGSADKDIRVPCEEAWGLDWVLSALDHNAPDPALHLQFNAVFSRIEARRYVLIANVRIVAAYLNLSYSGPCAYPGCDTSWNINDGFTDTPERTALVSPLAGRVRSVFPTLEFDSVSTLGNGKLG